MTSDYNLTLISSTVLSLSQNCSQMLRDGLKCQILYICTKFDMKEPNKWSWTSWKHPGNPLLHIISLQVCGPVCYRVPTCWSMYATNVKKYLTFRKTANNSRPLLGWWWAEGEEGSCIFSNLLRNLVRLQKWNHMERVAALAPLLISVGGSDSLCGCLIFTGYSLKSKP